MLERPCRDCGYDGPATAFRDIPSALRRSTDRWVAVLERSDARVRPDDATWSPLEYAAHVRDAHRIFRERLQLVLAVDDPEFPDWDQDATAVAERYGDGDPAVVLTQLVAQAHATADAFALVGDTDLGRTARRSDGSVFTVDTLGRYFLHDPVHHLWDVRG